MALVDALPVVARLHAQPLRLYNDHICDRDHCTGVCPYPSSAQYTEFDAFIRYTRNPTDEATRRRTDETEGMLAPSLGAREGSRVRQVRV
jgi:hypothetical protein